MEPRNPTSAVFFFFFFSKPNACCCFFQNQIYCIWNLHLARLVQNTLRLTRMIVFSKKLYLLRLWCGRKISCFLEKVSAGNKMINWSLSMNMIWVFAVRTTTLLVLSCRGSYLRSDSHTYKTLINPFMPSIPLLGHRQNSADSDQTLTRVHKVWMHDLFLSKIRYIWKSTPDTP